MPVPADPIAALEARIEAIDDEIARLAEERERSERALAVMRGESLQTSVASDTTYNNNNMATPQTATARKTRLKQAKHARKLSPKTAQLREAFAAKGDTMQSAADKIERRLAGAFSISQPYLTMAALGSRPMWPEIAAVIETLYGYAATKTNWPDLRATS